MKTIKNQDFSNRDHVGENWRFHVFVECDFQHSKIIDCDVTGATFHNCNLDYCDIINNKANGVRWAMGEKARFSYGVCKGLENPSDEDEKFSPEEIEFAEKNGLFMPGSHILMPGCITPYYKLPCEEWFCFITMPEDILKKKPADYVRKRLQFCFTRANHEATGTPIGKGWPTEDYRYGSSLEWLFGSWLRAGLGNIEDYLCPGIKKQDKDNFYLEDHPLMDMLVNLFMQKKDSFKATLRAATDQERIDAGARWAEDVEYVGENGEIIAREYFKMRMAR